MKPPQQDFCVILFFFIGFKLRNFKFKHASKNKEGGIPLSNNFHVLTHSNFTRINEIEAMNEMLLLTFYTSPPFYLRA